MNFSELIFAAIRAESNPYHQDEGDLCNEFLLHGNSFFLMKLNGEMRRD
jgi:hypothetical protein